MEDWPRNPRRRTAVRREPRRSIGLRTSWATWLVAAVVLTASSPAAAITTLNLLVGNRQTLTLEERVEEVEVRDDRIAKVTLLSEFLARIEATREGRTRILFWTVAGQKIEYQLVVVEREDREVRVYAEGEVRHRPVDAPPIGIGFGLGIDARTFGGRITGVLDPSDPTSGRTSGAGTFAGELRYTPPLFERRVSLVSTLGWFTVQGDGRASWRDLDNDGSGAVVELGPTAYDYRWRLSVVPLLVGIAFRPPLPVQLAEEYLELGLGLCWMRATVTGQVFDTELSDEPWDELRNQDLARGGFFFVGAGYPMGPVHPFLGYQLTWARTHLNLPDFNPEPASLGGHSLRLGFRIEL